jgi:hypothetical protein
MSDRMSEPLALVNARAVAAMAALPTESKTVGSEIVYGAA